MWVDIFVVRDESGGFGDEFGFEVARDFAL